MCIYIYIYMANIAITLPARYRYRGTPPGSPRVTLLPAPLPPSLPSYPLVFPSPSACEAEESIWVGVFSMKSMFAQQKYKVGGGDQC